MTPRDDEAEGPGDMIFVLAEWQDRIARRLEHKIKQLERRVKELENRGRP